MSPKRRPGKDHHHLAHDLWVARMAFPREPHAKDAATAFLSRVAPACHDPTHRLCARVRSAAEGHQLRTKE